VGSLGLKFWGTRGLISSPRAETAIFGGNTTSIQVLHGDDLIVVDTGFGCTNLGEVLLPRIVQGHEALTIHVLYTHFHWDHIQGLPFFTPIYFPSTQLRIYSPETTPTLLDNLDVLFDGSYSPFESLLTMPARIQLERLSGPLTIGDLTVTYMRLDHGDPPTTHGGCDTYAYKLANAAGESVVIATDHEARDGAANRGLVAFAKGCDILVHDGQFLEAEYAKHVGWGHSSVAQALDNATRIAPALTLLTHHAPQRNDKDLQAVHRRLMQAPRYRQLRFEFAREEIVYDVARARGLKRAG
jgi:phosphoribosyl 1,2-cyclic phosphodiesterase